MAGTKTIDRVLRILITCAALAAVGWTTAGYVRASLDYSAWMKANHEELGRQRRIQLRFERRMDSHLYPDLPEGTYQKDLMAAELARPVAERLESERQELYELKRLRLRRLQIGAGIAVLLLIVVRFLTPRSTLG